VNKAAIKENFVKSFQQIEDNIAKSHQESALWIANKMPSHRYEPVSVTDSDDSFALKEISSSNDTPSYFSGTPTSAPPSFHSRTNSLSGVEQPVPFGAVIPGSVNNAESTNTAAWTSSSSTSQNNEMIGKLLARIEILEAEAIVKRNEDAFVDAEGEDDQNPLVSKGKRKDRCCSENVVAIIFMTIFLSILSIMLCVVAIVWIKASAKRNSMNCGPSIN